MIRIFYLHIIVFFTLFSWANSNNVDFNTYSMNTPISYQFFNRFEATTINAFNIPEEYIATLQAEGRLIDVDTTKWKYKNISFSISKLNVGDQIAFKKRFLPYHANNVCQ